MVIMCSHMRVLKHAFWIHVLMEFCLALNIDIGVLTNKE